MDEVLGEVVGAAHRAEQARLPTRIRRPIATEQRQTASGPVASAPAAGGRTIEHDSSTPAPPVFLRWRAAIVLMVVLIQLGVPTYVMLTQERPARFGWHMFAALRPEPTATAEYPSGSREVDLTSYIPRPRPEVDYVRVLPGHLCEQLRGAIRVTVSRGEDISTRECDQ